MRGAAELRVKESDRIAALVAGFRNLGIDADEHPDGFAVRGGRTGTPSGGVADACGDHRMAMAFAIAALGAARPSVIEGAEVGRHFVSWILRDARASRRVKTDKIYLVGFMAAGKTTVARALAKRLDWQAADIDELIEQRERQTVAEIFARQGEPYFRAAERLVLLEQTRPRHLVVATGGGTFVDPYNRAAINRDGVSIWLDVPLDRAVARLPADGRRPLAADRAEFERLYQVRKAAYEYAHLRVDAGRAGVDALVEELIAHWLHAIWRRRTGRHLLHALSRPDRHSCEPRGARRLRGGCARARVRSHARARRHRRLRCGSERGDWPRAGARSGGDRPRESRQGGSRARMGGRLQPRRQERGALDARCARRRSTGPGSRICPKGPRSWTT